MLDMVLFCARAAHELNKLYCETLGDNSQKHWEDSPEWQKDSAISGVKNYFEMGGFIGAKESHENWFDNKKKEGWVYGATKDDLKKTHPCMLPYDDLPSDQRLKDKLFIESIRLMLKYFPYRMY